MDSFNMVIARTLVETMVTNVSSKIETNNSLWSHIAKKCHEPFSPSIRHSTKTNIKPELNGNN